MSEPTVESLADELRREVSEAQESRTQYLSGLRSAAGPRTLSGEESVDSDPVLRVLTDRGQPEEDRLELLRRLASTLGRRDDYIDGLLTVVRDSDDAPAVRQAALRVLAAAAFQVERFAPHQQPYEDALHDLVGDPDPGMRDRAVSILAQRHDPVVQESLLAGLRGDRPLPVDRERAVRLLAEDDHVDVLPLLQDMYREGSPDAKQEAVRFMGSYPDARETLEGILRDKSESPEVRQQSAASLRYLAPETYEATAKEIATDTDDDPDVRTASLTALQHLGDPERVYGDADFVGRVEAISQEESTSQVTQVARELLDRRPAT
ncbi:HEAT repeat domain-containing protein [Geodermatophilus sp. URMC 64]